jgi:hypothetical protein
VVPLEVAAEEEKVDPTETKRVMDNINKDSITTTKNVVVVSLSTPVAQGTSAEMAVINPQSTACIKDPPEEVEARVVQKLKTEVIPPDFPTNFNLFKRTDTSLISSSSDGNPVWL